MFKIMLQGKRSFIVGKADVIKGGSEKVYNVGGQVTIQVQLDPGKFIYEVNDQCGQFLESFADVFVLDKPAEFQTAISKEGTVESTNALLVQAMTQIAELQKQVLAISSPKKKPVAKKKKSPVKKEQPKS